MPLLQRCIVAEVTIHSATYYYSVALPNALDTDQTANLVLETVQTHATYPFPPEAGQDAHQALKYDTELLVLSPYKTLVQRTKFRCVGGSWSAGIVADESSIIPGLLDSRSSVTQNQKKSPSRRTVSQPRVIMEALSRMGRSVIFRPPRIPLSLRRTSRRSPSTMSSDSLCWPSKLCDAPRKSVTGGRTLISRMRSTCIMLDQSKLVIWCDRLVD